MISLLKASAPARIVNVASVGQAPLRFEDIMLSVGYSGVAAYRQSKLAMIAWGARRSTFGERQGGKAL